MIRHDDHYRGVSYAFLANGAPGPARFRFVSPDFFRLVSWEGPGLKPVGYGFDSVAALVAAASGIDSETADLPEGRAKDVRRRRLAEIDAQGLLATPSNSGYNELVIEAARLSIASGGDPVRLPAGETEKPSLPSSH